MTKSDSRKKNDTTRRKIGSIAKNKKVAWFKRIDMGEAIGNEIFAHWEEIAEEAKLKTVVTALAKWVIENDQN